MILSADEFVSLRASEEPEEYNRAASEQASESVWMEVISHYPDMRLWVARNKTVPLTILRVLAGDPDPAVRGGVASKRKLDRELFVKLAGDPDEGVRLSIARNAKVPEDVLTLLCEDPEPYVREVARDKLASTPNTK